MTPIFRVDINSIGAMIDLIINGPVKQGPHGFVLVFCPDFEGEIGPGLNSIQTYVVANIHPEIVAKILAAAAEKAEEDATLSNDPH